MKLTPEKMRLQMTLGHYNADNKKMCRCGRVHCIPDKELMEIIKGSKSIYRRRSKNKKLVKGDIIGIASPYSGGTYVHPAIIVVTGPLVNEKIKLKDEHPHYPCMIWSFSTGFKEYKLEPKSETILLDIMSEGFKKLVRKEWFVHAI